MINYNELRDGQAFYSNGYKKGYEDAKKEFERPQGEWLEHSTYKNVLICSNCHHGSSNYYDTYKFCPNCGADMRGVKHENR